MSEFVYEIAVKQYTTGLESLKNLLQKAKLHAEANKFDPNKFLDLKLAPDMFNFTKQVQIISDTAKATVARMAGREIPSYPDTEKTWEELMSRIDKTIHFVSQFKAGDFKDYAKQKATFVWNPGSHLSGHEYFVGYSIPNFYFHLSMVYALLRGAGVQIGKSDYVGKLNWIKE